MPLYEISHSCPFSDDEKDELAKAITYIHSRTFTTPSIFVNVQFIDAKVMSVYIGGKKSSTNRIFAHVRPGGSRSTSAFNTLCTDIVAAWDKVVNKDTPDKAKDVGERELKAVFVMPTIESAWEVGVLLPKAGDDVKWLKENKAKFEERARGGDEDMMDVVREMEEREDLKEKLRE